MQVNLFKLLGVLGTVALLSAGCGSGAAPTATPAPTPTRAPATPTPVPVVPTPTAAKVVPTGTFAYAKSGDLNSIDGRILGGGYNWDYGLSVYESLVIRGLDGSLVPGLATSWKVADDGRSVEFALRKGVKWHNGDAFAAEDVKYTLESIFDPELKSAAASGFRSLDKVQLLDDYRVALNLKNPDASLLYNLEWYGVLVPARYAQQLGYKEFAKRPVGTGPFKFVRWSAGEVIELEAFADHWSRVPQIKTVLLKIVPELLSRVAMLKTGEVDMMEALSPGLAKEVQGTRGLYVAKTSDYGAAISMLNSVPTRDPANKAVPLRDKRVRQALNYAIDKKAILDAIFEGEGVLTGGPLGPSSLGYDPSLAPPYPYDPEKAKALLTEAGYGDGFDLELNTGPTGDVKKQAEALAGYLNAVRIRARVVPQEGGKTVQDVTEKRVPPVIVSWGAWIPTGDIGTFLAQHPATGSPWGAYSNPELDKMIEKLKTIYDLKERSTYIGQITKLLHDEAPYIYWFARNQIWGLSDKWDWQPIPGRATSHFWSVQRKR